MEKQRNIKKNNSNSINEYTIIKNAPEDDIENFRKKSSELKSKEIQEIHKDINTTDFDEDNDIMDHDDNENIEDLKSVILNSTNANEEI